MKTLKIGLVVLMGSAVATFGISLGDNITIMDGVGSGSGWYSATHEDQEVEPDCVANQGWDLEGFFLNGLTLNMVGGYDFVGGNDGWNSGDIFLDVNGDAKYGSPITGSGSANTVKLNTFGWDYVLDMNFATKTYDVYHIDGSSRVKTVWYAQNDEANPWRFYDLGTVSGGAPLTGYRGVDFQYLTGLSDAQAAGLQGGSHNVVSVDLSFLPLGTEFTAHFTYQCGNDNLMGHARIPDGGSTMVCLGLALLGIDWIRRMIRA